MPIIRNAFTVGRSVGFEELHQLLQKKIGV